VDELNAEELNADARELIARAMTQDEPPPGAEDQSWGMVVSRVDERSAIVATASTVQPLGVPRSSRWIGATVLATALLAVVGLGAWVVLSGPPPQPPQPFAPTAATGSHAGHTGKAAPLSPAPRGPQPPPATAPDHAVATAGLLADAEAALLASDPTHALALLEQHAARAPIDQLQRRLALRIRTLCALDRTADARSEAVAFLERHPSSQWAADVRGSCAGR
jgi:hypothetical protein